MSRARRSTTRLPELLAGVQSGADRRRADVQLAQLLRRGRDVLRAALDAGGVAAEFLSERDRHRILQMGAAGLENAGERLRLFPAGCRRGHRAGGDQRLDAQQQRQPRRGRENVVRRLAHVDVVVGVHPLIGPARFAEDFGGAVREHLVRVHVVRRAGAGLIDIDDELIAERAGQDLVGGGDDRARDRRVEAAERGVRLRPRLS